MTWAIDTDRNKMLLSGPQDGLANAHVRVLESPHKPLPASGGNGAGEFGFGYTA